MALLDGCCMVIAAGGDAEYHQLQLSSMCPVTHCR